MTEFVDFDYEKSRKQRLEKEIDELILVAETFYTRIKTWNPEISESEAKKIALNIAVTKKYEPALDVTTTHIENYLDNISTSLYDICQELKAK